MRKHSALFFGLGALCTSGVVVADNMDKLPQFYGHIGYELQMLDKDISEADGLDWRSYLSRFGVRNSHEINDNLKATYQLESFILHKAGGDELGLRNTYGGVKSDSLGEIRFGRHDTPYKRASLHYFSGANMLFDAGTGSSDDKMLTTHKSTYKKDSSDKYKINLGRGFISNRFERWHGTLHYISPDLSGLQVEAAIRPEQEGSGATQQDWVDYSTSLTYRPSQSVMVNAAYESEGQDGESGVYTSWQVGALFTANAWLTVGAQLDNLEIDPNNNHDGEVMRVLLPVKMSFGDYYVNTFLKRDDFDYDDATDSGDDCWLDAGVKSGYFLDEEHKAQVYAVGASAEDREGINYGAGFRYQW